jgi:hypothetical protein
MENSQVASLSLWSFLPRLLPAPHALIRSKRPERLSEEIGRDVVGSHSGNVRHSLNHVASILHHKEEDLPAYSVRLVRIDENPSRRDVTSQAFGPLTWLAFLGFGMSIALLVLSITMGDGMSLLATIMLSILSTLVGWGNYWTLKLPERKSQDRVPDSDVVIRYPQGAFLIVRCTENVARRLYFAPESCEYLVSDRDYRLISLAGTILLMFGVIFLANATLSLQIAWAAAYIVLNAAFWIVAALSSRRHWDLSAFSVERIEFTSGEGNETYTKALWQAIAITRSSRWARVAGIAPNTKAWDCWLQEAETEAQREQWGSVVQDKKTLWILPQWDPQAALIRILNENRASGAV